MAIAWPLRSVLAGTAGTATMTLAYAAERRLRPRVHRPLDLLGRTPPPWRWPADVVATSVGTHVADVSAVAAVDDGIRRRESSRSTEDQ